MNERILPLSEEQIEDLEIQLAEYDKAHISYKLTGDISLGIFEGDTLIAGLDACVTAFKILYVSTVFVQEAYRRKGYGKALMLEMERQAKQLGVNTIRLDTFDWQGRDFYLALDYQEVGHYVNSDDGYEEYFFLKRI